MNYETDIKQVPYINIFFYFGMKQDIFVDIKTLFPSQLCKLLRARQSGGYIKVSSV
jgi:hypothetical protein